MQAEGIEFLFGRPPEVDAPLVELDAHGIRLAAGVASPRLDVAIVGELPREQGHSARFKLVESRVSQSA